MANFYVDGRRVEEYIGERIADRRRAAGMSQTELGRRLSKPVTHAAVSQMEAGQTRIPVGTLYEVADALGVEPWELLPVPELARVWKPPAIAAATADEV